MELKVVCHCGQKYKFDVEPANRQMPFTVNCPICGADGTYLANTLLVQKLPPPVPANAAVAPAPAMAMAQPAAGLSIRRESANAPVTAPAVAATASAAAPGLAVAAAPAPARRPVPASYTPAPAVPKYMRDNPAIQNNNFFLGIVGAVLGAVVAVGFMIGTRIFFGFSFPYFGPVMGALIGFGARLLYRGTDFTLGAMCAVVAFLTIGATLFLMFGIIGMVISIVAVIIGTIAAFKIASG